MPLTIAFSVTDSDGVSVQSKYDNRNLLASRLWSTANMTSAPVTPARIDFSYNGRRQMTTASRYADLTATNLVSKTLHSYDSVGRTDVISHRSAVDAVLAEFDTDWNTADELLAWTNNGQRTDYQYDRTGQLISADHNAITLPDEAYQYDATGNRVGAGKVTGSNNRLLADEQFNYSYDAQGNTIEKEHRSTGNRQTFKYDHENRMIYTETRNSLGTVSQQRKFTDLMPWEDAFLE